MSRSKPRASGASDAAIAAAKEAAAQYDEAVRAAAADAGHDDDLSDAADDDAEASEAATEHADDEDAPDASAQPDGGDADAAAEDDADAAAEDDAETADAGELAAAVAQRDDYLQQLQRQRAEFQNYRRRVDTERRQQVAVGVSRVVESLLPVLDGCEAAAAQGHAEVDAVGQALIVALGKAGLERIDAVGEEFDPTQHEAVIFEQASADDDGDVSAAATTPDDGDTRASDDDAAEDARDDEADPADLAEAPADDASALAPEDDDRSSRQIVVEELRSGYRFDGRVLRAAMVKVRTG